MPLLSRSQSRGSYREGLVWCSTEILEHKTFEEWILETRLYLDGNKLVSEELNLSLDIDVGERVQKTELWKPMGDARFAKFSILDGGKSLGDPRNVFSY